MVRWSKSFIGGEIDFLTRKGDELQINEATGFLNSSSQDIDNLIREFANKYKQINMEYKTEKIKKKLFITGKSPRTNIRKLVENGIEVILINRVLLTSIFKSESKAKQILHLLGNERDEMFELFEE